MSRREIKFRGWDEQAKEMHHDFKFISSGDEGNDWIIFISDKRPLTDHKTNPFENPEPYFSQQFKKMQYTGLKDKNGVEIYEGDILDPKDGETPISVVCWCNDVAAWCQRYTDKDVDMLCEDAIYDQVIGNIYENPELLEENHDS